MTIPTLSPRALAVPSCLLLLLSLCTPAQAVSEPVLVPLNRLIAAMRDELAAPKPKGRDNPDKAGDAARQALRTLIQIKAGPAEEITDDDLQKVLATFRTSAVSDTAYLVKAAISDDQARRALIKKRADLLLRVKEATVTAKTAADLDSLRTELLAARRETAGNRGPEENSAAFTTLSATLTFVNKWQDYLTAKNDGDRLQARQALTALADPEGESIDLIPRSELLALIAGQDEPLASPVEIITAIRGLEDISGAVSQLQKLSAKQWNSPGSAAYPHLGESVSALSGIDQNYHQYLSGVPITLPIPTGPSGGADSEIDVKLGDLRAMLLKKVMPRFISAPAGLESRDDESLVAYLDRVTELARAREDSALADRARDAGQLLGRNLGLKVQDQLGLKYYGAARNQETAGQFMLAVTSYLDALKSGSDLVPARTIGARLAALRAGHPDDYRQGLEKHLLPAPARAFTQEIRDHQPYSILIPAPSAR